MSLEAPRLNSAWRSVPKEITIMVVTALAALVVVGLGALISAALPDASPWLFAGCYAAPAAALFALYWVVTQRN